VTNGPCADQTSACARALRIAARLWPLWLFWSVWDHFSNWWLAYLLTFPDRSTATYAFAYHCWPTVALLGPILLMAVAIGAYRLQLAHRTMPIAGIAGVLAATVLTAWPDYRALLPYIGSASLADVVGAIGLSIFQAVGVGLLAALIGAGLIPPAASCSFASPSPVGGCGASPPVCQ
jgi:hypothetical protein